MKKLTLLCLMLLATSWAWAQHMDFCGVSMEGKIADFAKALKEKSFRLKEKRVDDCFYIMEGTFCGVSSTFTVSFTPRTKTVYQIRVMPRHINETAFVEHLTALYGTPEEAASGLKWEKEHGGVFYIKVEGMDPYVIIMDAEGYNTLKEEK